MRVQSRNWKSMPLASRIRDFLGLLLVLSRARTLGRRHLQSFRRELPVRQVHVDSPTVHAEWRDSTGIPKYSEHRHSLRGDAILEVPPFVRINVEQIACGGSHCQARAELIRGAGVRDPLPP